MSLRTHMHFAETLFRDSLYKYYFMHSFVHMYVFHFDSYSIEWNWFWLESAWWITPSFPSTSAMVTCHYAIAGPAMVTEGAARPCYPAMHQTLHTIVCSTCLQTWPYCRNICQIAPLQIWLKNKRYGRSLNILDWSFSIFFFHSSWLH